ncbi:MAG TPA: hypothetical protein VFT17_09435 [Propionibacteriaceae bacterium]|nr:hypothetical protein [Propionibacteriaceae bacterium]
MAQRLPPSLRLVIGRYDLVFVPMCEAVSEERPFVLVPDKASWWR